MWTALSIKPHPDTQTLSNHPSTCIDVQHRQPVTLCLLRYRSLLLLKHVDGCYLQSVQRIPDCKSALPWMFFCDFLCHCFTLGKENSGNELPVFKRIFLGSVFSGHFLSRNLRFFVELSSRVHFKQVSSVEGLVSERRLKCYFKFKIRIAMCFCKYTDPLLVFIWIFFGRSGIFYHFSRGLSIEYRALIEQFCRWTVICSWIKDITVFHTLMFTFNIFVVVTWHVFYVIDVWNVVD